jgi:RNA recognition motif-containing protein
MKIYVGNLPFSVDEAKLKELFSKYETEEVTLIKDKFSGRSKGFGFVVISNDESAKEAISEFNDKEVEGRQLKVSEAKPMDPDAPRPRRSFGGDRDGPRRSFGGNRDGGQRRSFGAGSGNRGGGQRRY